MYKRTRQKTILTTSTKEKYFCVVQFTSPRCVFHCSLKSELKILKTYHVLLLERNSSLCHENMTIIKPAIYFNKKQTDLKRDKPRLPCSRIAELVEQCLRDGVNITKLQDILTFRWAGDLRQLTQLCSVAVRDTVDYGADWPEFLGGRQSTTRVDVRITVSYQDHHLNTPDPAAPLTHSCIREQRCEVCECDVVLHRPAN